MKNSFIKNQIGLDREEAQRAIKEFLKSEDESKVFALKGSWGVGKTHLVKTLLSYLKKDYHYGSLFGISTVDELKIQLWINFRSNQENDSKPKKWDIRNLFQNVNKNSKDLGNLIEAIPSMGNYGAGFTPAILSLASNFIVNQSLQNKLICIDDLERSSKDLSLRKILGFIEDLTEEKKCKVILIFNEDRLMKENTESKDVLKEYREKVIDFEIKLDPSAEENFSIAFEESYLGRDIIFDYFIRSRIRANNIRVLKKIKLYLDKIKSSIEDCLPSVQQRIINEVIFITLSKFDINFFIGLDDLVSLGDFKQILNRGDDEEKGLYLQATRLGYTESKISHEIIRLVETSICDDEVIREESSKLNDKEINNRVGEQLSEAYKPYLESFESSEAELRKNLITVLESHVELLSFRDFQEITDIANVIDLEIDIYLKRWLEYHIDQSGNLESLYFLQSVAHDNNMLSDSNLKAILNEKIANFEKDMSIDVVLIKILNDKSWSKRETDYLNSRTLDEWKQWLLTRHPDKHVMIRQGLKMEEESSKNLEKAITDLAQDSALNKMRAGRLYNLGIE